MGVRGEKGKTQKMLFDRPGGKFGKFGENRQRNATVRVTTHRQTDRQTQTDFIICPMSHAICYSYGADENHKVYCFFETWCTAADRISLLSTLHYRLIQGGPAKVRPTYIFDGNI